MTLSDYLEKIEAFLRDYLRKSGFSRYVIGVSGGVDSSLVLALAVRAVGPENVLALIIPIESDPKDVEDARRVAELYKAPYEIIDLSPSYRQLLEDFAEKDYQRLTKANLKVRMRMVALYAFAQEREALVLGTDNRSEHYVGYFTKYGDGSADLQPIIRLTKREVVEAALLLGLPEDLARRVPSAGLYPGQSDEEEMRLSYQDLDDFLLGKPVSEEAGKRIRALHRASLHKVRKVPEPGPYIRDQERRAE